MKELAACSGINNPNRIQPKQIIHKPGTTCVAPRPVPQQVPNPAPLPSGGIVETAISFAMAQLGDPYVWAANGPDSWDCSGLVHAAFNYAGKSITRSTRTLINEGSPVGRDSMMRGDLVFPDDGHVGIYLVTAVEVPVVDEAPELQLVPDAGARVGPGGVRTVGLDVEDVVRAAAPIFVRVVLGHISVEPHQTL